MLLLDATGLIRFHRRHRDHCLVQRHGERTPCTHHVLEAKLPGPGGVVVSLGGEFVDDADVGGRSGRGVEQIEQDRELAAAERLLPRLEKDYPRLGSVLAGDSLHGRGPPFALAREPRWSFVVTFEEGRTPALRRDYGAPRAAGPGNVLKREWKEGVVQEFRRVKQSSYQDRVGREWPLNALECTGTTPEGKQ